MDEATVTCLMAAAAAWANCVDDDHVTAFWLFNGHVEDEAERLTDGWGPAAGRSVMSVAVAIITRRRRVRCVESLMQTQIRGEYEAH